MMNNTNISYLRLIDYIRAHHYLTDAQFEEFELYDDLLYDFNRLKCDMRQRSSFYDYRIISLGENCLPITIMTKWGLEPTLAQSPEKKRLPFDLAFHPLLTTLSLLRSNFDGYVCNIIEYKYHNEDKNIFRIPSLGITFNHDEVNELIGTKDNFISINKKLTQRVKDFYDIIKRDTHFFLLYISGEQNMADIEGLEEFCHCNLGGRLLVIFEEEIFKAKKSNYFYSPLPYPGYYWAGYKDCFSNTSFDYEFHIAEFVINHIETTFKRLSLPKKVYPEPNIDMDRLYLHFGLYECDIEEYGKALFYYKNALKYTKQRGELHDILRKRLEDNMANKKILL